MLDILVGDVLPHIYCRQVLIENSSKFPPPSYIRVTLYLEMYIEKNKLIENNWLSDLKLPGTDGQSTSLLDSLKIRIAAVTGNDNVGRLNPALRSVESVTSMGNIIGEVTAPTQNIFLQSPYASRYLNVDKPMVSDLYNLTMFDDNDGQGNVLARVVKTITNKEDTIGIPTFGNTGLIASSPPGLISEKVFNGKLYYVYPTSRTLIFTLDESVSETLEPSTFEDIDIYGMKDGALGFVFFPYLDIGEFLDGNEAFALDESSLYYTGSPNTVSVFRNKEVVKEIQTFRLPSGKRWEGPVHYHGKNGIGPHGPDMNGYIGFMTGLKHRPNIVQPKLTVTRGGNNKIVDFRDTNMQKVLSSGIFDHPVDASSPFLSEASQALSLMPYQKENAKSLTKDNDSEFSKLYITRDRRNNARGFFYFDMKTLLKNNSKFSSLHMRSIVGGERAEITTAEAMQRSQIVLIKLYRDRVTPRAVLDPYKKFADQTSFEEPSRLIGTATVKKVITVDNPNGETVFTYTDNDLFYFKPVTLGGEVENSSATTYFVFHDKEVGTFTAGHYQYRIELEFKDGTYEYLKKMLNELLEERRNFEKYVDIYKHNIFPPTLLEGLKDINQNYRVGQMRHWNVDGQKWNWTFSVACAELGYGTIGQPGMVNPWYVLSNKLLLVAKIFGVTGASFDQNNPDFVENLAKIASPYEETGYGPAGLEYVMNLADRMIDQLTIILDGTKLNKKASASKISGPSEGPTDDQITRSSPNDEHVLISPHKSIIYEQYHFDGANEVFEAVQNDDFYVDYLSSGYSFESSYKGLLSLTPGYYHARSRLGDAKMSPLAAITTVWEGNTYGWNMMGPGYAADGNIFPFLNNVGEQLGEDNLARTSYSFKLPAIIEVSDPSDSNKSFGYIYNSFKSEALQILNYQDDQAVQSVDEWYENFEKIFIDGDTWVYPSSYESPNYSTDVLLAASNYISLKKQTQIADLSISYNDPLEATSDASWEAGSLAEIDHSPIRARAIATRESYKNIFDRSNLTFHEASKFDEFFGNGDKHPGATSISQINDEYNKKYQRSTKFHTDGDLRSQNFFYSLVDLIEDTKVPKSIFAELISHNMYEHAPGDAGPATKHPLFDGDWHQNLPNNFKLWFINGILSGPGQKYSQVLTAPFLKAREAIDTYGAKSAYSAFAFFNYNMTARIEIFEGHKHSNLNAKNYHTARGWVGDSYSITDDAIETVNNPKNDMWRRATRADFDSGQLSLYRIKYVDKTWLQGVEIPMLDKYFFVQDGAMFDEPDYTGWAPPPVDSGVSEVTEWESENHETINEWQEMLEKGLISEEEATGDVEGAFSGDDMGFGGGAGTPPPDEPGLDEDFEFPDLPGLDNTSGGGGIPPIDGGDPVYSNEDTLMDQGFAGDTAAVSTTGGSEPDVDSDMFTATSDGDYL